MNLLREEAGQLTKDIVKSVGDYDRVEVVLSPPFTSLSVVLEEIADSRIELGAQNVATEDWGEYTGEISAPMLVNSGCKWVIVGHSERRNVLGEVDELINAKIKASLKAGLTVILCVGETLEMRDKDETKMVIESQIVKALGGLTIEDTERVVFAYEPVWAIGTGITPTPDEVERVHDFIRHTLGKNFGISSEHVEILYGGSVNEDNIEQLLSPSTVNGALVGRASLKADSFVKIVKIVGERLKWNS